MIWNERKPKTSIRVIGKIASNGYKGRHRMNLKWIGVLTFKGSLIGGNQGEHMKRKTNKGVQIKIVFFLLEI